MALEALALLLWIPLGLAGIWFLATGRRMMYGLPKGMAEGWPLRVFGLAYVAIAGYLMYRAVHDGSFSTDGLVAGYVALVALVLVALYRSWTGRTSHRAGQ